MLKERVKVEKMISITELAKLFNTTVRTIRYYEEVGLINEATRINGKRYFKEKETIQKLDEVFFLKKLKLKLRDIELVISNPLYVKPMLLNIRLSLIHREINDLNDEIDWIKSQLNHYNWEEIYIEDKNILEKIRKNCSELSSIIKVIKEKKKINKEDSQTFVQTYKLWQEKVGIKLSENHIKTIAFSTNIILEDDIKKIFQTYCQENNIT